MVIIRRGGKSTAHEEGEGRRRGRTGRGVRWAVCGVRTASLGTLGGDVGPVCGGYAEIWAFFHLTPSPFMVIFIYIYTFMFV